MAPPKAGQGYIGGGGPGRGVPGAGAKRNDFWGEGEDFRVPDPPPHTLASSLLFVLTRAEVGRNVAMFRSSLPQCVDVVG